MLTSRRMAMLVGSANNKNVPQDWEIHGVCTQAFIRNEEIGSSDVDTSVVSVSTMPIDELRNFVAQWIDYIEPDKKNYYDKPELTQVLLRSLDTMISYRESNRTRWLAQKDKVRIARQRIRWLRQMHRISIKMTRTGNGGKEQFDKLALIAGEYIKKILMELNLSVGDLLAKLAEYTLLEEEKCGFSQARYESTYVVRMLVGVRNVNWNNEVKWQDFAYRR